VAKKSTTTSLEDWMALLNSSAEAIWETIVVFSCLAEEAKDKFERNVYVFL
jgi:hypothetical protein